MERYKKIYSLILYCVKVSWCGELSPFYSFTIGVYYLIRLYVSLLFIICLYLLLSIGSAILYYFSVWKYRDMMKTTLLLICNYLLINAQQKKITLTLYCMKVSGWLDTCLLQIDVLKKIFSNTLVWLKIKMYNMYVSMYPFP